MKINPMVLALHMIETTESGTGKKALPPVNRKWSWLAWLILVPLMAFFVGLGTASATVFTIKECEADRIVVTNSGAGTDCSLTPQYCATILFSSLRPGSDAIKAVALQDLMNVYVRNRELLSTIDLEDPTQIVNPGETFGESFYWCDDNGDPLPYGQLRDGNTSLCSITAVVTVSDLPDGSTCPISIRAPQNCAGNPDFPSCAP